MFNKKILASVIAMSAVSGSVQALEIEEIVVTAQKREQSMQDVGIAIQAFSGQALQEMGLKTSTEIASVTPNLTINSPAGEGGVPAIVMRGVGLSEFSVTSQPPVGFNFDGVPAGNANTQVNSMFDVERVEVLKGPQGTLYGKNTTGGAINIISNKPTQETEGYVMASAAKFNTNKIEAAVGGSLTDNLQARIAVMGYETDGYTKNTNPLINAKVEKKNYAARLQLAWQPTDDLDVLLNLHSSRTDSDAELYAASSDADFYSNASEFRPKLNVDSQGASVTVTYDLSDSVTLTSLTAYDDSEKLHQEDGDMIAIDIISTEYTPNSHGFSQELRLNGASESSNWIAGVFYGRDLINANTYLNIDVSSLYALPQDNVAGEWWYDLKQDATTMAVFGQYEFELTDSLRLTTGLRATRDEIEFESQSHYNEEGLGLPVSTGPGSYYADLITAGISAPHPKVNAAGRYIDKISNTEMSGKIGLDWDVSEDVMLYGSVSRGYKTGAFPGNFIFNADALTPYKKEVLTAYEAGLKGDFLDGDMRFNAAFYFYDYKDAQVFNNADDLIVALPANRVVNLDVEVKGLDADLTWQPAEGLYLTAALGITDAKYKQNLNDVITGPVGTKDKQLQNAPKTSYSLLANYSWAVGDSTLSAQVDSTWQSRTFFNSVEDATIAQDDFGLVGARLTWANADDSLKVALWGRNLEDKQYSTYVYDLRTLTGDIQFMRGTPRTVGADVTYSF